MATLFEVGNTQGRSLLSGVWHFLFMIVTFPEKELATKSQLLTFHRISPGKSVGSSGPLQIHN